MTTQNVLQTVDCNVREPEQSPLRKRAKLDTNVADGSPQRWMLSQTENELDFLAEMGLGMLDTDDLPEYPVEFDLLQPSTSKIESQNNVTNPNLIKSVEKYVENNVKAKGKNEKKKKDKKQKRKDLIRNSKSWEEFCLYKRCSIMKQEESEDWFSRLSDEIVLMIFRWVPKQCLSKCALVCKRWYSLSSDETLWSRLDCSTKTLEKNSLGHIIGRQVILLKLAQSEVLDPAFSPNCKAVALDFSSKLMYLDLSLALVSTTSLCLLLSKCNRIRKISLEHCTVDNEICRQLANNVNLEILNMSMVSGLSLIGIKYILQRCEQIKELNIAWTCLNTDAISYLCTKLPRNLIRLNVSGCRKTFNNTHIKELVMQCPNLVELDLSDCTALSNDSIKYIVTLQKLDCLALSRCYGIHCNALKKLNQIRSLMYLDIHGGHITQAEIEDLKKMLGTGIEINKFTFSSIARPTVGSKRCSIWGLRVHD